MDMDCCPHMCRPTFQLKPMLSNIKIWRTAEASHCRLLRPANNQPNGPRFIVPNWKVIPPWRRILRLLEQIPRAFNFWYVGQRRESIAAFASGRMEEYLANRYSYTYTCTYIIYVHIKQNSLKEQKAYVLRFPILMQRYAIVEVYLHAYRRKHAYGRGINYYHHRPDSLYCDWWAFVLLCID